MVARLVAALTAVAESDLTGHVLVVSHGAAIRSFVHTITGIAPAPLANTALFSVSYGVGGFTSIASE